MLEQLVPPELRAQNVGMQTERGVLVRAVLMWLCHDLSETDLMVMHLTPLVRRVTAARLRSSVAPLTRTSLAIRDPCARSMIWLAPESRGAANAVASLDACLDSYGDM